MSEDEMLKCLIAFILGWLVSRQMGNGFSVGGAGIVNCEDISENMGSFSTRCVDSSFYCKHNQWTGKCE